MSVNSNFRKDKCWSCEFFSGKREFKRGIFFGDSVETDNRGKCTNKRSSEFNHEISDSNWCSKYQKWGVLQSALAMEQQKKETQRVMAELKKQQAKLGSSLSSEPIRELTEEEKAEMAARREQRRIEEEQEKERQLVKQQENKINKVKRSPFVAGIVGGFISLLAFLLGWIPYWYWDNKRATALKQITELEELGHDVNEPIVQEIFKEGLHAKEMRNSISFLPYVLLIIGIIATVIAVVIVNQRKQDKLKELTKD